MANAGPAALNWEKKTRHSPQIPIKSRWQDQSSAQKAIDHTQEKGRIMINSSQEKVKVPEL
jgi:hypothetical protein